MCDFYADEVAEVWKQTTRRAKKEYRCQCCGSSIRAGQRYEYTFTVFEGEAHSTRACLPCSRAIATFGKAHSFYPDPFSFSDYLNECIDDGDDDGKRWRPMRNALNRRRTAARAQRVGQ